MELVWSAQGCRILGRIRPCLLVKQRKLEMKSPSSCQAIMYYLYISYLHLVSQQMISSNTSEAAGPVFDISYHMQLRIVTSREGGILLSLSINIQYHFMLVCNDPSIWGKVTQTLPAKCFLEHNKYTVFSFYPDGSGFRIKMAQRLSKGCIYLHLQHLL